MTTFGLVRPAVGDDKSARSKYCGPTGKRSAGKLACSVWSGGKAARPYLSLFEVVVCSAPRRQLKRRPLGRLIHAPCQTLARSSATIVLSTTHYRLSRCTRVTRHRRMDDHEIGELDLHGSGDYILDRCHRDHNWHHHISGAGRTSESQ